ncbi:MAG: hypothetical protein P8045_14205 [Candidatus Thiodiazotropha sp.]
MEKLIQQWVMSVFAIFGAFFFCGIGGAGIAGFIGLWETPSSGFCAAFGVVSMAYISAPSNNKWVSLIVFSLGAILAWFILEPSSFPESYQAKAYQQTHLPFIVTVAGGLISLSISVLA